MTTFVLVHGAWHGPWAWERVVPLLHAAGAHTLTPDLSAVGDHGLHDHATTLAAALDDIPDEEQIVLVGHSYAGLVVREAADTRPEAVDHIVLLDGWAGPDGTSLFDLAPEAFVTTVQTAAQARGDGRRIPAPAPAAFGITDSDDTDWLAARLLEQPLRTFTEPTRLSGAVDRIPGTAIYCRPQIFPFEQFGASLGYRTRPVDGPHDIMLTQPESVARTLWTPLSFKNRKRRV